jgi:hypothetical protein
LDNSQHWTTDDIKDLENEHKKVSSFKSNTEGSKILFKLELEKNEVMYVYLRDIVGVKSEYFEEILKGKSEYELKLLGVTKDKDNKEEIKKSFQNYLNKKYKKEK